MLPLKEYLYPLWGQSTTTFSPGLPALIPTWPTGLPSISQRVFGSLVGAVRDHLCRQFIVFQTLCIGGNSCHHRHLSCFATGNRMLTTALKRIHLSNLSTQALLQVTTPIDERILCQQWRPPMDTCAVSGRISRSLREGILCYISIHKGCKLDDLFFALH